MPPLDLIMNVAIGGVLMGLVYGLIALGLSVIFGVMRVVNFAHGEMMTLAMYATVMACEWLGSDPFVVLLPVTLVLAGLGFVLQAKVINRFITRPEHVQLLLMIAIAIILQNGLLMIFGPDARSVQTEYQFDSFQIGPLLIDTTRVYAGATALLTTAALMIFFRTTLAGKAIRACADNHFGARVIGLRVERLYALTFALGAGCVAVAGCVLAPLIEVTPAAAPTYTLLGFVVVILGGLGSMLGALLGGVLVGFSEAMAGLLIEPSAKSMVSFALLIGVLLFRPQGLLGQEP
jgi:branched-chain amino acid transport system permease protein